MQNQNLAKHSSLVGQMGETIACKYLESRGYEVMAKNYWRPWGEIDIIAFSPKATLVFVEVKTMDTANFSVLPDLLPEDNMTGLKIRKLRRACSIFANENVELIEDEAGWQIDLVAVQLCGGSPIMNETREREVNKLCTIRHYENI